MYDDDVRKLVDGRLGRTLRGKYRLERVLGVGGMAAVYVATHRNRKRFAVKMLHPHLSIREGIRARFLREGYLANSVEHPGAVAVLDDDVAEDGSAFLVMELLEGATLDEMAEQQPRRKLPLAVVLSVSDALLDVLTAAHEKGVVHRDLKPANLFLTDDGRLEVLDFGIARLHDDGPTPQHATQTGAALGTPAFMAPEQAAGESAKVDARSDLWAVGATMFTLLSGEFVHEATNAQMLMVRAATGKPRAIAAVAPEVPKAVAEVIDRALAFEKSDRWDSAKAMREALTKAAGTIVPLPRAERVTGLEETVAAGASMDNARAELKRPGREASGPGADAEIKRRGVGRAFVGVILIVIGAAAGGVAWRKAHEGPTVRAATASASAAATASAPRPGREPATPDAKAEWEAAIQAEHDGNDPAAERHLRAAITSDPSLGAAHLRLAMFLLWRGAQVESYAAFRKAVEHRASMGDVDAALLDAAEPRFRDPPDRAERAKRMAQVAARYPDDPHVQFVLSNSLVGVDSVADAERALRRALASDPTYAPAYVALYEIDLKRGDASAASEAVTSCLQFVPSALGCMQRRLRDAYESGRCVEVKEGTRSMFAIDPGSQGGFRTLASALFTLGEPADAVAEALHQADAQVVDPIERRSSGFASEISLALAHGDLGRAAKLAGDRGVSEKLCNWTRGG